MNKSLYNTCLLALHRLLGVLRIASRGLSLIILRRGCIRWAVKPEKITMNVAGVAVVSMVALSSAQAAQIYYLHEQYVSYTQAHSACYGLVVYKNRCSNATIYDGTPAIHYWSLQPNGDTHNHIFFYSSLGKSKGVVRGVKSELAACAGNPIVFSSGNKLQSEVDYMSSLGKPLAFSRVYNGLDGIWRHNYSAHLRIASNHITLVMSDGYEIYFRINNGLISGEAVEFGSLSSSQSGWDYVSASNELYKFDALGRLIYWSQPSSGEYSLTYSGAQIAVSNLGQTITFTEDNQRQPLTMSAGNISIQYAYNSQKRLTKLTKTINGIQTVREYHYENLRDPKLLTGITDERGVRYATWAYDDQGRAISSEHADGAEKVLIAYNADGSSTVTNELGKTATYRFQTIEGVKHITAIEGEPSANCPNSNSTFTYDSRGLLKTKTDNKGHLTTFDYNERGLEVSRTEAAGTPQARTVTTDWHPTLFLPITVTEPSRITHYTYDDQGRQLSQSVTQR